MGPVGEIEALGFGTLWLGGSPSLAEARAFLEATSTLTVATAILNVWGHEPADVAAGHAELRRDFGDRFLLGIGIGHPEATSEYKKPLTKMGEFLDGLDAADPPVPRDERVVAALGPKMLDLAAERSLGAHPYFTTA
jgi:probable F420-dependent oxidoreductase